MERLRNCSEHGYNQFSRHGTSGHCSGKTDGHHQGVQGRSRLLQRGVLGLELELAGTPYDGFVTCCNWTGGMLEMFVSSGLLT